MFYKFTFINRETGEETTIEAMNKASAIVDGTTINIDAPVYPSPFDGAVGNLTIVTQIVRKLCYLYSNGSDTLYTIAKDARRLNAMFTFFNPEGAVSYEVDYLNGRGQLKTVEFNTLFECRKFIDRVEASERMRIVEGPLPMYKDFEEYAFSNFAKSEHDTQDIIMEGMANVQESITNAETVSEVLESLYNRLNHYIFEEKKWYNDAEVGSYSTKIQDKNGEIIRDVTDVKRALWYAMHGDVSDDNTIISVISKELTSDAFEKTDVEIIKTRLSGMTLAETANLYKCTVRHVRDVFYKLQRHIRKSANKSGAEWIRHLYTVEKVRPEVGDGEAYRTLIRA